MATVVTSSIGTGGRDYSTPQTWVDACPANLVTADQIWRGECYNDSEFLETVQFQNLTVAGVTADATRYEELTAAPGHSFIDHVDVRTNPLRYDVSKGVGFRKTTNYNALIMSTQPFLRVNRIQLKGDAGGGAIHDNSQGANGVVFKDLLADALGSIYSLISCQAGSFINIVGVFRGTSGHALQASHGGPGTLFQNCVVVVPTDITHTSGNAYQCNYNTDAVMRSCASFGMNSAAASGRFDGTASGFNATNLASGLPGTNNQHSVSYTQTTPFTDADKDSLDLRPVAATLLDGNGFLDATNAPNDITGTARSATPTIGAWELASAPAAQDITGSFLTSAATAFFPVVYPVQTARPSGDTAAGGWTPSTGSDLYSMLDEATPNDADYIRSGAAPVADAASLTLSPLNEPEAGDVILRIRHKKV